MIECETAPKVHIRTRARQSNLQNSSNVSKNTSSNPTKPFVEKTGPLFESVYRRKNEKVLADRIAAFRKKQEKKREKINKILAKREARRTSGLLNEESNEVYYKGIGVTDEQVKSKASFGSLAGKLTKAESIGGIKRVLKPSSKGYEVVELENISRKNKINVSSLNIDKQPSTSKENNDTVHTGKSKHPEYISEKERELQNERDLMAELLKIGEKAIEESSSIYSLEPKEPEYRHKKWTEMDTTEELFKDI